MKTKTNSFIPMVLATMLLSISPLPAEETTKTKDVSSTAYEQAAMALKDTGADDVTKRKSFETMKRLANEGHLKAMAALGYLYQEGVGTPPNPAQAANWYGKAAEKGHAISMYNIARLLVTDLVPLPDGSTDRRPQYAEAVEWYRKAADAGLDAARSAYGIILLRGDYEIKASPAKAAPYLEAAAKTGDLEAMNALGTMYDSGNGVAQSQATSEYWFRKAAEGGHLKARSNLAELLDPSSPNSKRRVEAIAWLLLAEEDKDVVGSKMMVNKGQSFSAEDLLLAKKEAARIRKTLRKSSARENN
jgi:TPR repeat protein